MMRQYYIMRAMRIVITAAFAMCALPLMAYVPEPRPVKSAVEITAIY